MNIQKSLLVLLPILAIGCESVDSIDVRTEGIYASIDLVATGDDTTTVTTALRVGGRHSNTYLDLSDGDRLMGFVGADAKELDQVRGLFGALRYESRFDTQREDARFRIAFTREGHDEAETQCRGGDAANSFATLPAPFEIRSPEAGTVFSAREDDIVVSWSNPNRDDDMSYSVSGDCIESFGDDEFDDEGRFTIKHEKFKPIDDRAELNCTVNLRITRYRQGHIDSAYGEGGTVTARQSRTLSFEIREWAPEN